MTRKEFINICALFGISIPLNGILTSCKENSESKNEFNGKVVIVGAGAGGLSAGYYLNQHGINFEILEASSNFGGRIKINNDFADFPIPLGAEWIETNTTIFQEIVNDDSKNVNINTVPDNPDSKFVNYSWYNFFEEYIFPSISSKITFNSVVKNIDYNNEKVKVSTDKEEIIADKVIISVPLQIIKNGDLSFSPNLPLTKINAINGIKVWDGFKAFFEFSENFYGNKEYVFQGIPLANGQKIYYNAALGQETNKNILGLFVVGEPAKEFINLSSEELKLYILNELDEIYNNQATKNYKKHITQNWNEEPFIKGAYMSDLTDWKKVKELGKSISDKLYFAGGEFTDGSDWVSVHTASLSAKRVVNEIIHI